MKEDRESGPPGCLQLRSLFRRFHHTHDEEQHCIAPTTINQRVRIAAEDSKISISSGATRDVHLQSSESILERGVLAEQSVSVRCTGLRCILVVD